MDVRQHALLARLLIEECGGPEKIEAVGACRCRSSQLYAFTDARSLAERRAAGDARPISFMPMDVVVDLEAYCGKPIYSQAAFEARPATHDAQALWEETCEATESAAELQRLARVAHLHPGGPTPRMRTAIEKATLRLEEEARQIREANERGLS